jgi:ParB family transcriptional regulator, chromosome partitioning protein
MPRSATSSTKKNPNKKPGLSRSKDPAARGSSKSASSIEVVDKTTENLDAISSLPSPQQAEISALPNQQLPYNETVSLAPSNNIDSTSAAKTEQDNSQKSLVLPLHNILLPKSQPRRYFDEEKMESLTHSVQREGILQPILVRPLPDDNYELVAGERRLKASRAAGLKEVPVVVLDLDETSAVQYALLENLMREDLNPLDETEAILQLLALRLDCSLDRVTALLYKMDNASKNKITRNVLGSKDAFVVFEVFKELGKINWQSFIRARLPLLDLQADVLEALRYGQIEYTKALEIGKVKSDSDRAELLENAISLDLSLKEIRAEVKKYNPTPQKTEIQTRMENTYKLFKKSKAWDSPELRDKLEPLLEQMEAILGVEL